jgi:Ring finger domain
MADTAELFNLYPIEAAIVLQRGLEIGAFISLLSLSHCCYLLSHFPSSEPAVDEIAVAVLAVLRLLAALPRPLFWLKARRLLVHARGAAHPQAVARRLIAAGERLAGSVVERMLMWGFYSWIALTLAISGFSASPWLSRFWRHAWATVAVLVLHRILGVAFFLILLKSDLPRGLSNEALAAATRLRTFEEAQGDGEECGICYAPYQGGESVRVLSCGHAYHPVCVDPWLQGHRSVCPLCLRGVGVSSGGEDNKED